MRPKRSSARGDERDRENATGPNRGARIRFAAERTLGLNRGTSRYFDINARESLRRSPMDELRRRDDLAHMPRAREIEAEILDEHGDWIRFADQRLASVFDRAHILVRMYTVTFQLNGVTTRQNVITSEDRIDAARRLTAQYPKAEIRVLRSALTAVSWRWMYQDGSLSEPDAHDNVTGETVDRGYYEWWTSDLLAAARRVAAGKPLDIREAGRTPRTIAGWLFRDVRRVLRQERGEGFVLQDVAQVFPPDRRIELPEVIKRLTILGYLDERAPGWWRVTRKGRRFRERSEGRFSRLRALALIANLNDRIATINADSKYLYKVKTAVVFGSALDEHERVGDVDVAVQFVARHSDREKHEQAYASARDRAPSHVRQTIAGHVTWPSVEVQAALVEQDRRRISLRDLDELERLFAAEPRPPKYQVIFGSWTPPKRLGRKRLTVNSSAKELMKRLVGGRIVRRRRVGRHQ